MDKIQRLKMKGVVLNNESLWVPITISAQEEREAEDMGILKEAESKRLGLKSRSFSGDVGDALARSIAAKRFEFAIRRWGCGTARVVKINEFHDFADVGLVNARYTFNPGYGMMITDRDQ